MLDFKKKLLSSQSLIEKPKSCWMHREKQYRLLYWHSESASLQHGPLFPAF